MLCFSLSTAKVGVYILKSLLNYNSSLLISPYSGLESDPDSCKVPCYSNSLLFLSSIKYLTNVELKNSLVLFFFKLNSNDC